jgi:hypothetical protein
MLRHFVLKLRELRSLPQIMMCQKLEASLGDAKALLANLDEIENTLEKRKEAFANFKRVLSS